MPKIIKYDDSARDYDGVWALRAKRLLRAEMKRHGLTYAALALRLSEAGEVETARNISNKVSRGRFSAAFLLKCLSAMNVKIVALD